MNPVFIFLVLITAFLFWVFISFAFPAIGRLIAKIADDVKYNSSHDEKKNNKESGNHE